MLGRASHDPCDQLRGTSDFASENICSLCLCEILGSMSEGATEITRLSLWAYIRIVTFLLTLLTQTTRGFNSGVTNNAIPNAAEAGFAEDAASSSSVASLLTFSTSTSKRSDRLSMDLDLGTIFTNMIMGSAIPASISSIAIGGQMSDLLAFLARASIGSLDFEDIATLRSIIIQGKNILGLWRLQKPIVAVELIVGRNEAARGHDDDEQVPMSCDFDQDVSTVVDELGPRFAIWKVKDDGRTLNTLNNFASQCRESTVIKFDQTIFHIVHLSLVWGDILCRELGLVKLQLGIIEVVSEISAVLHGKDFVGQISH